MAAAPTAVDDSSDCFIAKAADDPGGKTVFDVPPLGDASTLGGEAFAEPVAVVDLAVSGAVVSGFGSPVVCSEIDET